MLENKPLDRLDNASKKEKINRCDVPPKRENVIDVGSMEYLIRWKDDHDVLLRVRDVLLKVQRFLIRKNKYKHRKMHTC